MVEGKEGERILIKKGVVFIIVLHYCVAKEYQSNAALWR